MTNREIFYQHLGLPSMQPLGLEINKAEGIYLYEPNGKQWVDLVSGVSVSNIGHRHPKILQAIQDQLSKYMHLMVYGEIIQEPQSKLAQLLKQHLPENLDNIYFVNSGSEAIEGALKLAKRFTGRTEIIAFKNAYHGGTHGALSILGNEKLKYAYRPLLPDIRHLEFNHPDDLSLITEQTACVVVETIQAEAGIILPQNSFLKKLSHQCSEMGALLIVDDIQMGFGRTGKFFSFEHFDIEPDILCLAKAMGGGMPIGAFISSQEIMGTLTFNPELGHITTFGGHPVNCVAAEANIKVLDEENWIKEADHKGKLFKNALADHPAIGEIRQIGLMLGVDIKSSATMDQLMNNFISNNLLVDRFLFRPDSFRIAPPLCISEDEIQFTLEKIITSLPV